MSDVTEYQRKEIMGTGDGGRLRIKVTSDTGASKWLSITSAQRDAIADVLDPPGTVSEINWEERAGFLDRAIRDIAAAVGLDPENATTHQTVTAVRNQSNTLYPQGTRVELAPHTDAWMSGDRYGEVITVGTNGRRRVRLDRSGRSIRVFVSDIARAIEAAPEPEDAKEIAVGADATGGTVTLTLEGNHGSVYRVRGTAVEVATLVRDALDAVREAQPDEGYTF